MDGTPKLTPEVSKAICASLKAGHYRKVACAKVRITERTLQNWQKWGEEGREPYAAFLVDMQEAEAHVEDELLQQIRCAMPGVPGQSGADVWTARAWVLERRWPKRWAARVRTAVAEEVDMFTAKLKAKPELWKAVVDELADEAGIGGPAAGGNSPH